MAAHLDSSLKPAGKRRPCRLKRVSQIIDDSTKRWKERELRHFFHDHDVDEILKIRIPWRHMEDTLAWHYEKSACFSVRSAYRLAINLREVEKGLMGSSTSPNGDRPVW